MLSVVVLCRFFIVTKSVVPLNVVAPKIVLSTCRLELIVQYMPS
jgi:hypothetical protein